MNPTWRNLLLFYPSPSVSVRARTAPLICFDMAPAAMVWGTDSVPAMANFSKFFANKSDPTQIAHRFFFFFVRITRQCPDAGIYILAASSRPRRRSPASCPLSIGSTDYRQTVQRVMFMQYDWRDRRKNKCIRHAACEYISGTLPQRRPQRSGWFLWLLRHWGVKPDFLYDKITSKNSPKKLLPKFKKSRTISWEPKDSQIPSFILGT